MSLINPANCIWQGSNTATTGGSVILSSVALTGRLNFRDQYANGSTGVPLELYDFTSGVFEFSYGTLNYGGGGPGTDSISSRVITFSTNGIAIPVAWGSGTRDAFCSVAAQSFLLAENALGEMSAPQLLASLNRLNAASRGVLGLSGGSNGRVVRYSSSGNVINAQNSDSSDDLGYLLFKNDNNYYRTGDVISDLSGLGFTAGTIIWLGTNANPFLTSQPTASTVLRVVRLGRMMTSDMLAFKPSEPITR